MSAGRSVTDEQGKGTKFRPRRICIVAIFNVAVTAGIVLAPTADLRPDGRLPES